MHIFAIVIFKSLQNEYWFPKLFTVMGPFVEQLFCSSDAALQFFVPVIDTEAYYELIKLQNCTTLWHPLLL